MQNAPSNRVIQIQLDNALLQHSSTTPRILQFDMSHIELPKNCDIKGIYFLSIFFYIIVAQRFYSIEHQNAHEPTLCSRYEGTYILCIDETFINGIKKNL